MQATIQYIKKELGRLYPETEVKAFTRIVIEHVCGMNFTEQILAKNNKLPDVQKASIAAIVKRLKQFEPIQYILGETDFCGLKLKVTSTVLIPRPETEELVQWISKDITEIPSILDIGTGSGCIALSLKNHFQHSRVAGVDISEDALKIARENAGLNGLNVYFFQADILTWEKFQWKKYHLMVSNPPYVRKSEKELMMPNVLKYEPAGALFVPDSEPLIYYRRIAEFAQKFLIQKGWLYFEINENLGNDLVEMLQKKGFESIEMKKDFFGKTRFLRCRI